MTSTSTVHHQIEGKTDWVQWRTREKSRVYSDCFYEKRPDTSLNGYNDHHDRWISEFDCLDQCLKSSPSPCRSFEHWHLHRQGLCVRANVTLTDQPSAKRTNTFVNYYEIDCRKDVKGTSNDDEAEIALRSRLTVSFSCSTSKHHVSRWTIEYSRLFEWYRSELCSAGWSEL